MNIIRSKSLALLCTLCTLITTLSISALAEPATTVVVTGTATVHSAGTANDEKPPAGDFIVVNGVLTGYTGSGGAVDIPDKAGITSIGDNAFLDCICMTSVTIPSTVTSIGKFAFASCSYLTSVAIPDSVTAIDIGAFAECLRLESATIPSGLTSISNYVFQSCRDLSSVIIPSGVTSVGESAFAYCMSLKSVNIPNSVTSIGNSAFQSCLSLPSVIIPSSVTSIGDYTFTSCLSFTSFTIPSSITSVGNSVFNGCTSLASITIPNNVTSIGKSAFSGCANLNSLMIPNTVTSIGEGAFEGCTSLTIYGSPGSYAQAYAKTHSTLFALMTHADSIPLADGATAATVSIGTMDQLISALTGTSRKFIIDIIVTTEPNIHVAALTIPGVSLGKMASATDASLQITTGIGTVTFDSAALDNISAAASGDITITITKVDHSTLDAALQSNAGDNPLYQITVTSNGREIPSFGGTQTPPGHATVIVPYTPATDHNDPDAIAVFCLDPSGNRQSVTGRFNAVTGAVTFETSHFSYFIIEYNKVTFKDVPSGAWYYDPVTFIAARTITTGTGDGIFNPYMKLTRGQFIVMLLRAYGIDQASNAGDNFSDVGNTYYTGYLAAAKQRGIAAGVGNNMFAPEKEITRQEMFTLLYNTLKATGHLPTSNNGKSLYSFNDSLQLSSWARDPAGVLIKTGIIRGTGGKILPQSPATRAEMAQVLYNILRS